jgi:hypothetical protein
MFSHYLNQSSQNLNHVEKHPLKTFYPGNRRSLHVFDIYFPPNSDRVNVPFSQFCTSMAINGFQVKSISVPRYGPGEIEIPWWSLNARTFSLCSQTLAGGNGDILSTSNGSIQPMIASWPNLLENSVITPFGKDFEQPLFIFPQPLLLSRIDFFLVVDGQIFIPTSPFGTLSVIIEFIY